MVVDGSLARRASDGVRQARVSNAERGGARTGNALSRQALTDAMALAQQLPLQMYGLKTRDVDACPVSVHLPSGNFQYSHSQSLVNKGVIVCG